MRSRPGAETMMAGTRLTPYSAAFSLSSTRFSTSSATSGFSATICSSTRRVGAHVSHPIDCSKKMSRTLLEQIIERLARTVGRLGLRLRMRLALDGHARREQLARIPRVLRRDAREDRLRALEPLPCVERLALGARAEVRAASFAPGIRGDCIGEHVPASRAPHHFMKAGHARCASFERLALGLVGARFDAIRGRAWRLRRARAAALRPALARCILVAPLPILTIRHETPDGPA